jgi:hypothetical protein
MRAASFDVDIELLRRVLQMPDSSTIIQLSMNPDGRSARFVVDDPLLPEADKPHNVKPICSNVRWDWNLDDVGYQK